MTNRRGFHTNAGSGLGAVAFAPLLDRDGQFHACSGHDATDELGFQAVENRHYITDIHATRLHQLGLDPHRLEVPVHKRLEIDFGNSIRAADTY